MRVLCMFSRERERAKPTKRRIHDDVRDSLSSFFHLPHTTDQGAEPTKQDAIAVSPAAPASRLLAAFPQDCALLSELW